MLARLIINADDFGLTAGVNRSIEELHRAHVLSSTTLMANGPAFEDAVAVAKRNLLLGVGCHIVLTDGIPVCPPATIPSLVPNGRTFYSSLLVFTSAVARGKIRELDILREALAQIGRLQASGISVTHLDTHKHTHLFPTVSRPLLEAARVSGVRTIRNPFEQPWSRALHHGTPLRQLQIRLLNMLQPRFQASPAIRHHAVATTNGTFGIADTGHLDTASLQQLLEQLPQQGVWELVCHPGYSDHDLDRIKTRLRGQRQVEHAALLTVIPQALSQPAGPLLIHYGDLAPWSHAS